MYELIFMHYLCQSFFLLMLKILFEFNFIISVFVPVPQKSLFPTLPVNFAREEKSQQATLIFFYIFMRSQNPRVICFGCLHMLKSVCIVWKKIVISFVWVWKILPTILFSWSLQLAQPCCLYTYSAVITDVWQHNCC